MQSWPTDWRALQIFELADALAHVEDWVLCGGHSVALLTGEDTRAHGDIDVGVFRSQLSRCLKVFGPTRVALCHNGHVPWDGNDVPPEVHDIWITDAAGQYWILQIMVYDDEGDEVIYRKDRRIRWRKKDHSLVVRGIRVLNPSITLLFKARNGALQEKEVHDINKLIAMMANQQRSATAPRP